MLSAEHIHVLDAPVDRTGGPSSGQSDAEAPQSDPLENPQQSLDPLSVDTLLTDESAEGEDNQPAARKVGRSTDLLTPRERRSIRPSSDYVQVWGSFTRSPDFTDLELPPTATAEGILARRDMKRRKDLTTALKWRGAPKVREQEEQEGRDPYPKWDRILFYALNLSDLLPDEIPPKDLANRIELARKIFRRLEKENKNRTR